MTNDEDIQQPYMYMYDVIGACSMSTSIFLNPSHFSSGFDFAVIKMLSAAQELRIRFRSVMCFGFCVPVNITYIIQGYCIGSGSLRASATVL